MDKFKLLGVVLDNRLKFDNFVYNQIRSINKKLYSIRRLLYLPFGVKLLFFKAFILPSFDYCISLSLYFSRYLLEKLGKMYYLTLFKLLGIKFENETIEQINCYLEAYGLQAFQYRLINRVLSFVGKMAGDSKSPSELRTSLERVMLINKTYKLRSNNKLVLKQTLTRSKFGDLIFKNLCAKLVKKLDYLNFYGDQKVFKTRLYILQDDIYISLINILPNFNLDSLKLKIYR